MIWRPASERAGRGVRAVSAGPGSGGGARLPVRARAGRGVPYQTVAQAARITRPRDREGGRAGRAARHRGGRGRRGAHRPRRDRATADRGDRKSTRLNSSHANISYAVFCLKKKKKKKIQNNNKKRYGTNNNDN